MQITFDPATFRLLFSEFADPTPYPDVVLQARWDAATGYMQDTDDGCLPAAKRATALQYLTAHLCRLDKMMAQAGTGTGITGVVTAAQIDKVQIQLAPPPTRDAWGYWLAQTPYGQSVAALMSVQAAGGFTVGGSPERDAFRTVGGNFGGGVYL